MPLAARLLLRLTLSPTSSSEGSVDDVAFKSGLARDLAALLDGIEPHMINLDLSADASRINATITPPSVAISQAAYDQLGTYDASTLSDALVRPHTASLPHTNHPGSSSPRIPTVLPSPLRRRASRSLLLPSALT